MHRDPFYDLFHKKTVDSLHITLISEGGNSLSKSPSPVCIDSLQVAHTCTAESQHLIYRSASSAHARYPAAPIGSLFTLPLDCAPGLDQGNIPEALRCGLGRLGLPLAGDAGVEVLSAGHSWGIGDRESRYRIERTATNLAVSRGDEPPVPPACR